MLFPSGTTTLTSRSSTIPPARPGAARLPRSSARGVFFSAPVDLDLMMLDAYPDAYAVDPATPDESTIVAVLGKNHANEDRLGDDLLDLFDDYHAQLRSQEQTGDASRGAVHVDRRGAPRGPPRSTRQTPRASRGEARGVARVIRPAGLAASRRPHPRAQRARRCDHNRRRRCRRCRPRRWQDRTAGAARGLPAAYRCMPLPSSDPRHLVQGRRRPKPQRPCTQAIRSAIRGKVRQLHIPRLRQAHHRQLPAGP